MTVFHASHLTNWGNSKFVSTPNVITPCLLTGEGKEWREKKKRNANFKINEMG